METKHIGLLEHLPLTMVLIFYVFSIVFINPLGNFPLNDDYVYSLSVKTFLESGQFNFYSSSSSCILHVLTGALISQILGFSLEILRCTTLVYGFIALVSFYLLLRELEVNARIAGISTFVAAINPVLINLQFTFMTDISSLTMCLLHQLFLVKGLKGNTARNFVLSGLFLTAAIMIRQSSVMWVAVNFVFFCLLACKKKFNFAFLGFLLILPVMAAIASDRFLETHSTMLDAYHTHKEKVTTIAQVFLANPLFAGKALFVRGGQLSCYLAMFTLPLLLPFFAKKQTVKAIFSRISIWHALALVSSAAVVYGIHVINDWMPFYRNIWHITCLGAYTLIGQVELFKDQFARQAIGYLSIFLSLLFTPVAIIGLQKGTQLLREFFNAKVNSKENLDLCKLYVVLTFCAGFAFTTMHLIVRTYDRYIMDLLFPTLALLSLSAVWLNVKMKMAPVLSLILLLGLVSVGQQQTYMSWNRARWQAIENLVAQGTDRNKIEGGAEYAFHSNINMWKKFKADPIRGHIVPDAEKGSPPYNQVRWWPIHGEDYVLSFVPMSGFRKIGSQPFTSFLPWEFNEILILKRNEVSDFKTAALENVTL